MWALYALLAAVSWSASDAGSKAALGRGADSARIIFVRQLVAVPLLLPFLLYGLPALDRTFWLMHLPWLPLETAAIYLYMRAIRVSPLSLTLPYLALTPLFLVVTGRLLLNERVGAVAGVGIGLVVAGSYVVNIGHLRGRDLLGPLKAMFREEGTRLMLIVALLYAFTSICGKVLVDHSSPTYFAVHFTVVMSLITAPAGLRKTARPALPRPAVGPVLLAAALFSISILAHMLALQTTPVVAYMIAVKRLSGAFGVLWGRVFFQERELAARLLGSLVMVLGGALIMLD